MTQEYGRLLPSLGGVRMLKARGGVGNDYFALRWLIGKGRRDDSSFGTEGPSSLLAGPSFLDKSCLLGGTSVMKVL